MGEARQLWKFHGGLRLPGHKSISTQQPIGVVPVPPVLIQPLSQHQGSPAEPIVSVGDEVLRGQPIGESASYIGSTIHSASSGTVVAIEERPVPHVSGLSASCIVVETDGEDRPWEGYPPQENYRSLAAQTIRIRVRKCGVVGLGGAVFPTSVKLNVSTGLKVLILNGAECEPYISCDDMLMRQRAREIVDGAMVMLHTLELDYGVVAIEEDKVEALAAMASATEDLVGARLEVIPVPTIYPEGGERQLIKVLTGDEVPAEDIPTDIGYLVQNVGTAAAVARAVRYGEALVSRIVTVTGKGVASPRNLEVRIGTPVSEVIRQCGGYTDEARHIVMGGAMMGFGLSSDEVPVVKGTNCLLVATAEEIAPRGDALPCIRCGECARVCPAQLMPQQLHWHTRDGSFDKAAALHLFDCIECGSCDLVCPSHIPLTEFFRYAKSEIWSRQQDRSRAEIAKLRFDKRNERLAREKEVRRRRLAAKTKALAGDAKDDASRKALIDQVMNRVRAKKTPVENGDRERD